MHDHPLPALSKHQVRRRWDVVRKWCSWSFLGMRRNYHVLRQRSTMARSINSLLRYQGLRWMRGWGMSRTTKKTVWRNEDRGREYLWVAAQGNNACSRIVIP